MTLLLTQTQQKQVFNNIKNFRFKKQSSSFLLLQYYILFKISQEYVEKGYIKTIEYGFVRMCIDKRIETGDNYWQVWAIFVRSLNGEEKLNYVDRVQFNLHTDFPDRERVMYQEPFETSVFGYLDCNAYITIFFKDQEIPPQIFQLKIKFNKQPYQKVVYRENLIFIKPSINFYNILRNPEKAEVYSSYLNHLDPKLFKKLHPNARYVNYEQDKGLSQLFESVEKEKFIDSQHASEYGIFLIDEKMIESQQNDMKNRAENIISRIERDNNFI